MANGWEDIYGIESGNILGAQGGGQNLMSIINSLVQTLQTGGQFGTSYVGSNAQVPLSDTGQGWIQDWEAGTWEGAPTQEESVTVQEELPEGYETWDDWASYMYENTQMPPDVIEAMTQSQGVHTYNQINPVDFNLQNLTGILGDVYGDTSWEGAPSEPGNQGLGYNPELWSEWNPDDPGFNIGADVEGGAQDIGGGMEHLYTMLQHLNLPGITSEYKQDVGDISGQIGSKMEGLRKGLLGGKTGRYSSLGAGGRPDMSRKKYLSEYSGLRDQEQEMFSELRGNVYDDFMESIAGYMGMFT